MQGTLCGDCHLHHGSHAGTGLRPVKYPKIPAKHGKCAVPAPVCTEVHEGNSHELCAVHAVSHALYHTFHMHVVAPLLSDVERHHPITYPEAVDIAFKNCKCPNYHVYRMHSSIAAKRMLTNGHLVVAVLPIRMLFDECILIDNEYCAVIVNAYNGDTFSFRCLHVDVYGFFQFDVDGDMEMWSCTAHAHRRKGLPDDTVIVC